MRFSETPFASLTKKTDIAAAVAAIGRYPVKAIAKTLDVARSNLIERLGKKRPERATYRKTDDPELLALIKELVDARPTYGYRRITALLNRRFKAADQPRVNHKRIYRTCSFTVYSCSGIPVGVWNARTMG